MKLSAARKFKKKHKYLGGLLLHNPVLVLGLDLPFVVATGTSLKNAVAMSAELLCVHLFTLCVAMVTCRKLPLMPRALVNTAASTVAMLLARMVILQLYPELLNAAGMYVYLMAVNGMTLLHANSLDKKAKPWPVLSFACLNVVGFFVAMLLVSALRELAGNATLWGIPVPLPFKISGLLVPFSGFIVTGMLLAALKYFNKRLKGFSILEILREEQRYIPVSPPESPHS